MVIFRQSLAAHPADRAGRASRRRRSRPTPIGPVGIGPGAPSTVFRGFRDHPIQVPLPAAGASSCPTRRARRPKLDIVPGAQVHGEGRHRASPAETRRQPESRDLHGPRASSALTHLHRIVFEQPITALAIDLVGSTTRGYGPVALRDRVDPCASFPPRRAHPFWCLTGRVSFPVRSPRSNEGATTSTGWTTSPSPGSRARRGLRATWTRARALGLDRRSSRSYHGDHSTVRNRRLSHRSRSAERVVLQVPGPCSARGLRWRSGIKPRAR